MTIPNYYSYKLLLKNKELSWSEKETFINQINRLYGSSARAIYRGDKLKKLLDLYGASDLTLFGERFFLLGPKANAFRGTQDRIKISDHGKNTFELIFNWLNDTFSTEILPNRVNRSVKNFSEKNPEFVQYFSKNSNISKFVNSCLQLPNEDQIKVRDYYLTLLHHNGESRYYRDSLFLSVTASLKVALEFAGGENIHEEQIIVFGWVPREKLKNIYGNPYQYYGHANYLNVSDSINSAHLPLYEGRLFPHEREVSLKGGLFPHFMTGFLHISGQNKNFHVNPAFMENTADWISNGLTIDQKNFDAELSNTALTGGFYNSQNNQYGEKLPDE